MNDAAGSRDPVNRDPVNRDFHLYLYGVDGGPLQVSFDEAAQRIQDVALAYFEPDGSFAVTDPVSGGKVFGMLYDAYGQLQYVELRGRCDGPVWADLIACFLRGSVDQHADAPLASVKVLPDGPLQDLQSFEDSWFGGHGR